jgi:hypothetical protein
MKKNVNCTNSQETERIKVKVMRRRTNRRDVEVNSHYFRRIRARAGNLKMMIQMS